MRFKRNSQRAMALGTSLLILLVLTLLAAMGIKLNQKSLSESAAMTRRSQLRQQAHQDFDQLRDSLIKDIQSKLMLGNNTSIGLHPIELAHSHYSLKCMGEGYNFKAGICTYDLAEFPKQVSLRIETSNELAEAFRISAVLSFAQAALSNMAYLILNEPKPEVNFGKIDFGGAVGIFFKGTGLINFLSDANFEELFFTNSSQDQMKFMNGAQVEFKKGVLTNGSGFSGMILENFISLAATAENPATSGGGPIVPFILDPGSSPTGTSELIIKLGDVNGQLGAKFYEKSYFQGCDIHGVCSTTSQTRFLKKGAIPDQKSYYYPGEVIIDSVSDRQPAILGKSNFTVIAQNGIEMAASLQRDSGLAEKEGNIALVDLGGKGIEINKSTKSLIAGFDSKLLSLGELPGSGIDYSNRDTYQIDSSLVALAPDGSPVFFNTDLFNIQSTKYDLAQFKAFGSLIGSSYSPSKLLNSSTSEVTAGFKSAEFVFNRGALQSSAPGMSRPSSNLITASVESFKEEDLTDIAQALADLN